MGENGKDFINEEGMVLDGDFRNGLYEKEEKMRILWNEGITEGKKGYERIYFGVN